MAQSHDAMVAQIVGEYRHPIIYILSVEDQYVGQFWTLIKRLYIEYENYYLSINTELSLDMCERCILAGENWFRNENCRDILVHCILKNDMSFSFDVADGETGIQSGVSHRELIELIRETKI